MFIPDPNFFHRGSQFFPFLIHIKEFRHFSPKKLFLSTRKYDLGCLSEIRIPDPNPEFLSIPDPGVKKAPDPQHCENVDEFVNCSYLVGLKDMYYCKG
jgi:hypothetical protein